MVSELNDVKIPQDGSGSVSEGGWSFPHSENYAEEQPLCNELYKSNYFFDLHFFT